MITKLTANNAELYYAPRFAEITAAFAAKGSSIQITSLEDYFLHLTDIAALEVGALNIPNAYLLVAPADEDIFAIDANSRAISIPSFVKKNGIGVYGDHMAEMIVMTIDRYFDHEDFLHDKIAINWNFTPSGARKPMFEENQAAEAFAANEEINPGKITFGFIITKDMTPSKGVLTFSVTIYDTDAGEISYSFNTLPISVSINDTLTLINPSIVKSNTANYVGRLSNSVFTNNTITPVEDPVWESGRTLTEDDIDSGLKAGAKSGLELKEYLPSDNDIRNVYDNGVILSAVAKCDPSTAEIVYKWNFKPLNGTIDDVDELENTNKFTDFIRTELPASDNGLKFYEKDEVNQFTLIDYDAAKAKMDAYTSSDNREYLPLTIKKLKNAPNDGNQVESQSNQDNISLFVNQDSNIVNIISTEELQEFESTNPAQGEHQWVGLAIYTGLPSIVGATWNGAQLTQADEDEAASVGLGKGYIIFWAKADVINSAPANISIGADGYKTSRIVVQYNGVQANFVTDPDKELKITNEDPDMPKFYVKGSSFEAVRAGKYQVKAQGRISAGENYEQIIDGTQLLVDKDYFLKDNNGNIDSLNPIRNEVAKAAQDAGKQLFVLASPVRNSKEIASTVLTIPAAIQPNVVLDVSSKFEFGGDIIKKEIDPAQAEEKEYIYIDSDVSTPPDIVATVTIDSDDARDKGGAVAVELITSDTPDLTLSSIQEKIDNGELKFERLPEDGKFAFTPESLTEGSYVVRAVNRRNGTYSVSEHSKEIFTSFVAPGITDISVYAVQDEDLIPVLDNGDYPNGSQVDLRIDDDVPAIKFVLMDNSTNNFEGAVTSYYIEEVTKDGSPISQQAPITDKGDEELDFREIVQDNNGNYTFTISRDTGFYRITVVNDYNNTLHTTHTKSFIVSGTLSPIV